MASKSTTLAIKIVGDASSGIKALDDAEGKAGLFSSGMAKAAAGAAVVVGAIGAIGVASFNAASDLEQSTGAINSVFGDWALDIEQSAQAAQDAVGLSTSAYENLASVIGAQLAGAGFAHDEMTKKTQDLISKGADLAATFGGTTAEAVEALSSVLKGETDPIERYGVSIKQSDIQARLAAEGHDKLTGAALKQATASAALAIVTEQTASSTGEFAKEADTAAGKQARLSAWWENAKATIGGYLLPAFVAITGFISDRVAPAIDRLIGQGGPLSGMFSQVGSFVTTQVMPAITQLAGFIEANLLPAWTKIAQSLASFVVPAFMAIFSIVANYVVPIIGTVLRPVIQGVTSAFQTITGHLRDNADKFRAIYENVQPLLAFLRDKVAPFVGGVLKVAFEGAGKVIGFLIDKIAWILEKGSAVAGFIGKLFGAGSPAGGAAARGAAPLFGAARTASPLRGASLSLAGGASSPAAAGQGLNPVTVVQVTFAGAVVGLDLDEVADQLQAILDRRARRTGAAPALSIGARA